MATCLSLLYITAAVLLSATTTVAQDEFVRNFQVSSRNDTHITFSWDIVDGSAGPIDSFVLLQRDRSSAFGENGGLHILYDDVNLNKELYPHFEYTTTVLRFGTNGYYLLWLVVNYQSGVTPTQTFSRQIFAEIGRWIVIEMNIRLWPLQTCHEFTGQSSDLDNLVANEVYYALRKHCQCLFPPISRVDVNNLEFSCFSSRYTTLRAHIYAFDNTMDPSIFNATLYNWLYGENTEKTILVYGRRYSVEPGPCGITVPDHFAPHCASEEPEIVVAPTGSATSYSILTDPQSTNVPTSPQSTSVYVPTGQQTTALPPYPTQSEAETSTLSVAVSPTPTLTDTSIVAGQGGGSNLGAGAANTIQLTQDHVLIIVVSVCATMLFTLILALLGCILVLILVMRLKHTSTKDAPKASGYWRSKDDTAWVLSPTHNQDDDDDECSVHKEDM